MQIGISLSLTRAGGRGMAPPLAAAVPYRDDFTGAAATLTGRVFPTGASPPTWTSNKGSTNNTTPIALDGSGHLNGNQNTGTGNTNSAYVEVDTGITPRKWYRLELNANPASTPSFDTIANAHGAFNINATYNSGNLWSRMTYWSGGGLIDFGATNNADSRTAQPSQLLHTNVDSAGKGVVAAVGDVWDLCVYTSGGSKFVEPYYNGQQIASAINISAIGITINDKFSLRGDAPSGTFDGVLIGDPDTHGMISVYAPRVAQINSDGSFRLNLAGSFSRRAPPSLTISLCDPTTGLPFTGYNNIAVANYATGAAATASSDGSWSGTLSVAGGVVNAANGCFVRVFRNDLVGGASENGRSGLIYPGHVIALYGQSLSVKAWDSSVSGLTYTAPSKSYVIDATNASESSTVFPATPINRKTRPSSNSNTGEAFLATAVAQARVVAVTGADTGHAYLRGGVGGTYGIQRQPAALDPSGSGIFTALLDGIRLAGNDIGWAFSMDGEYESNGAASAVGSGYTMSTFDPTGIVNAYQAVYDAIDAVIAPRKIKVLVRPVGAVWGAPDARCEAMRRLQWQLTQDFPSRYVLGGYILDLQHISGDQYHLVGNAFAEQLRRCEMARLHTMGSIPFDRTGPKLFSVTAHSDTSITVRFDKNGASALEIVNTAFLGDFHGGLRFATDAAFTSQKAPTAATVADVDATYADVTFTFASGSFGTAPVYVSGPYGREPFNPSGNTTVSGAMATNASMIRGAFSGEDFNIPVQPYYSNVSGSPQDYIIGS